MKRMLAGLCALLFLGGCAPSSAPVQLDFFAMDTLISVTLYGREADAAARAVQAELSRLERLWSRTSSDSEVSRLNAHAGDGEAVAISEETAGLLAAANRACRDSGGTFNPLMAPIMDAWGFTAETQQVPPQKVLDALLPLTRTPPEVGGELPQGFARLSLSGQALDLGGIAKGESAMAALEVLEGYEVTGGILSLGRNITLYGSKPDASPWTVAVQDPRNPSAYLCATEVGERTLSTSGGYERYFESGGTLYHHIIDPATGYPADSGLLSATVVCPDGAMADAYSTAFFVMGAETALDFWKNDPAGMDMDLVLAGMDNTVYITEGLKEGFQALGEENGYAYEFISR